MCKDPYIDESYEIKPSPETQALIDKLTTSARSPVILHRVEDLGVRDIEQMKKSAKTSIRLPSSTDLAWLDDLPKPK